MEGLSESTRDAPPSHFIFEIKSFSKLASSSVENYKSSVFMACDCKWKLVVYPNGNKSKGGEDHISLYLELADSKSEVPSVIFSLFVFDNIRHKYLYCQGVSGNHAGKSSIGFDKFMSIKTFTNPSNGYLVDDNCIFGAEVFSIQNGAKRQCLSMMVGNRHPFKYTWEVEDFSKWEDKPYYSKAFSTRGHDWKLLLYPKGIGAEKGKCLSLFLCLDDSETRLQTGSDVVVKMKLRIVDQLQGNHWERETIGKLSSSQIDWGWKAFINLEDLNKNTCYFVDDTCFIEAHVTVLGSAKMCD